VRREIDWWLTHRDASKILILVTNGEVNWHAGDADFDWNESTALNPRLRGQFADEPLWVDLRWARAEPKFSLRNSRFRSAVLQIAPPLYGKTREDLEDEDTRHYRNARRMAFTAILVLVGLAVGLTYASRVASNERKLAECRQLAGQSTSFLDTRLDLALLLGVEDSRRSSCVDANSALLTALEHRPHLSSFLSGHTDMVTDLAYTPDGKTLASSGWDHKIRFWDVQRRRAFGPVLRGIYGLSFSPDGKTLAATDVSSVNLWAMPGGAALGKLSVDNKYELSRVSFSPDGKLLAASSEAAGGNPSRVFLWDVSTRKLAGPTIEARSFAFSPDGKALATEGEDEKSIVLRDIQTRRILGPPFQGLTARVRSIAFSPDGQMIAAGGGENSVFVWNVADRRAGGRALIGHRAAVNSVAFSPDGKTLASGSGDGSVILWDLEHSQPIGSALAVSEKPIYAVAFFPDGRTIASTSEERVVLWDLDEDLPIARELPRPTHAKSELKFSPDGKRVATIDNYGQVTLSDAETGHTQNDSIGERTTSVAFSPDSKQFATVGWNGVVAFWDSTTGEPKGAPQKTEFRLFSAAFSPDGRTLAVGGDAVFLLWDMAESRWIGRSIEKQKDRIWSIAFSPNGKLIASGGNRSLGLWDAKTGSPLITPVVTDPDFKYVVPTDVAFSHDGKLLAYRTGDTGVALWDVAHRRQVGSTLSGHTGTVSSLAFSEDGKLLASGGIDNRVFLWDMSTREAVGKPLTGMGDEFQGLAFHPKTGTLATLGDQRLLLWDVSQASWREAACRVANRNLTHAEWNRVFAPGIPYRDTCAAQF
jgi:WD40 repeat protein